jgi:hypothetical protein
MITKPWKIAIGATAAALSLLLIFQGDALPQPWRAISSFGFAAAAILFARKSLGLKTKFRIYWKQVAKALGCWAAMLLWIPISLNLFGDGRLGIIVLGAPMLVLGTASLFFFSRSYAWKDE